MSNPYRPPDPDAPPRPHPGPYPNVGGGPAEGASPQGAEDTGNAGRRGRPGRSGRAARPTPPPPDPEALRAAGVRIRDFALFLLAALLTSDLPVPWQVGSLLLAIGAVVAGVRALIAVWRTGLRSALLPALGVGVGFAAMFAVSLGTLLAFWPLQVERDECLRDALTLGAREQCEKDFTDALDERLTGGLRASLTPGG